MVLAKFVKLDLKKKIGLSIGGFVLLIFFIIYFVIFPSISDIRNMKNEIEAQRIDLEIKYQKGQSLRKMAEKLKKAEEKISLLDQIFVNENDSLNFVTAIENVAGRNGVNQKIDLLASAADNKGLFRTVPLQLISRGNFGSQLDYLVGLETMSYYINIKSLELSSESRSGEGDSSTNLFISADTYWRSNQE